jgi:phosphatidylglycerophosphatase A
MLRLSRGHQNQHKISISSKLIATALFSGYAPFAPGTVGSLLAVLIYWFLINSNLFLLLLSVCFFILGVFTSEEFEKRDGHDPSVVVIDEVVGMWISLLFVERGILNVFVAFLMFRVMDVLKPFPARHFDKMSGGFGIMMDDVIAGVYANILTHIFTSFLK